MSRTFVNLDSTSLTSSSMQFNVIIHRHMSRVESFLAKASDKLETKDPLSWVLMEICKARFRQKEFSTVWLRQWNSRELLKSENAAYCFTPIVSGCSPKAARRRLSFRKIFFYCRSHFWHNDLIIYNWMNSTKRKCWKVLIDIMTHLNSKCFYDRQRACNDDDEETLTLRLFVLMILSTVIKRCPVGKYLLQKQKSH